MAGNSQWPLSDGGPHHFYKAELGLNGTTFSFKRKKYRTSKKKDAHNIRTGSGVVEKNLWTDGYKIDLTYTDCMCQTIC